MRCDRQYVGQLLLVQSEQRVDRGFVSFDDRRGWFAAHHALVAEILDDQETVGEIGVIDRGRR